jgi:hypothetical protein
MNKTINLGILTVVITVAVLFGAFNALKEWRFNSDAPEANYPPPADLAEARAQDMQHLKLFFELEHSWREGSLSKAVAAHSRLDERAGTLTDAEFELAVAGIVAMADNAHTKVREYNRTPRYNRLPIRGYWFADGYHVVRAYRGYEELLGLRLVAIDGRPVQQVIKTLSQYVPGPEGTKRKYTPYLLESPALLHAAGLADASDRVRLTLADAGGMQRDVNLEEPFPDPGDHIARAHALLAPGVYAVSQPDWASIHEATEGTPLYLRTPIKRLQATEIPELNAFYIQFWTNNNVGSTSITDFCEQALAQYRSRPTPVLIVDHRFNSGGNLGLTRDCMTELGESLPDDGRLYVVIGGATFSAGIYSVAFLMQSAGEKAMLVGEPVGDAMVSWGEDNLLRLPNSGIEIKFSTGKHDLANGCDDWKKCHWSVLFMDMNTPDMTPQIPAPLTYRDYENQIDAAIEAIRVHEQGLSST